VEGEEGGGGGMGKEEVLRSPYSSLNRSGVPPAFIMPSPHKEERGGNKKKRAPKKRMRSSIAERRRYVRLRHGRAAHGKKEKGEKGKGPGRSLLASKDDCSVFNLTLCTWV